MNGRKVLLIGLDPSGIDYSKPETPPGLNAASAEQGRDTVVRLFEQQGARCDLCELQPAGDPLAKLEGRLANTTYDCFLIGGGLRVPKDTLALFELVIEAIRRLAPNTPIAFNTSPADSVEAVRRRTS